MDPGQGNAGRAERPRGYPGVDAERSGARSLDVVEPVDPGVSEEGALTEGPFLVKVDRYGSVSGLVRVRVPLGVLVIVPTEEVSFGS